MILGIAACLAACALHAYPILHPWLFDDDFAVWVGSLDWPTTARNLWLPWNEHAMPLGRVTTWALVQLAGKATAFPQLASLQGSAALLVAMWLVYLFVRRELGHRFYGLVAMILFGCTLKYNEAVFWFTASFSVLALDTLLLALLAAQAWQHKGRWEYLVACAVACFFAPGWSGVGILAGPFCCLYLLLGAVRHGWKRMTAALVPCLGSIAFLALSLPYNLERIEKAEHFHGKSALEVWAPLSGLELTGRTIVDNLVLGMNALGWTCPRPLVPLFLMALALAGWCWWRQPSAGVSHRLMLLGSGFIVLTYWLIYSFRSAWPYETMMVGWTRYNLVPFLGLVLFVVGGLPGRRGTLFQLDPSGALSAGQIKALGLLLSLLCLLQLPQGIFGHMRRDPDPAPQQAALRQVERIDELCRLHHISAATACAVLERLEIPYSGAPTPRINGWELLRGSDEPRPISVDEARALLRLERATTP